jgi:hypothetical protein
MHQIEGNEKGKKSLGWVRKTETECCEKKVRSCLCRPRKQESRVWGIIIEAGVVILSLQVAKTKDSNDVERGGLRSSVEVAKVGEELAGEVGGFALDFAAVAH